MRYPQTLNDLIESFKRLPGIGEKTAERLALSTLNAEDEYLSKFATSLTQVKNKTIRCKVCNNYSEEENCEICKNDDRDKQTLCIVESPKNVIIFEKVGIFNGLYHVIDGLISPINGINPEDLNFPALINRIKTEEIKEIIIALTPTLEGETTSMYLREILKGTNIKITKIAHGIPLGADIEYIDSMTLELALVSRTEL